MAGGGNLVRNERYRKTPRTPKSAHARYYYTRSLVVGSPVRPRPNTTRSRCQSAPRVMDNHSRSASPREPARPQHRPPSPPSSPQSGFDNRAYQHDESDPNHNDSFTSNGPQQNGHSKEPNGDTKTLEAVNLELINLTPKNGAKKKDVEVDMNATNPYDEYFVPVNEHRKYMRGEKLYVTADKRGEKGGCKRPLCWTLLGLVVAAIVALIVLAATGILFTNSPTPLEQYNASVSSARAFGGITNEHNHDHDHSNHHHDHHDHSDHDHQHDGEQTTLPPQYVSGTQSDEAHEPALTSDETGDTSMYVPRTLEGKLKIDNEIFTPDMEDPESERYREFTSSFSDALKHALFDRNALENGDNEIMVEVIQIRNGSLVVTYRIHWIPKHNTEPNEDLLTAKTLNTNLNNYLNNNNRMISVYHVAEEELPTMSVLDICKINNNDCEYKCEFDDSSLDFMCVCPHGQIADMRAPKRCMPLLDDSNSGEINPETATQKEMNVVNLTPNESTVKTFSEEDKPNTETVRLANEENRFDWNEPRHYTPETTTEREPDLNFPHIFGPETPKPEPEPQPEPNAEPKPIPNTESTLLMESNLDSETEPKSEPEPTAEIMMEPETKPEPEPEYKPESEPVTKPEPEPVTKPVPEPVPMTTEPEATPEPIAQPEPAAAPEPTFIPEPIAEPEPMAEPKPTAEPNAQPELIIPNPEPEPNVEPKLELEPEQITEGQFQPKTTAEPQPDLKETTEFVHSINPNLEMNYETKSANEPKSDFEPNIEPNTESQMSHDTTSSPESTVASVTFIPTKEFPTLSDEHHPKQNEPVESDDSGDLKNTFDQPKFDLDSIIGLYTTAESTELQTSTESLPKSSIDDTNQKSASNFEINSSEGNENDNYDMEKVMATTMRVSLSEPHIINEPSYEPKPEVISILRENGPQINFTSVDTPNYTTVENDWLQHNNDEITDENPNLYSQTTSRNINDEMNTEMQGEVSSEHVNKTEQRSSKKFDDFASESTTNSINENYEDITFDLIKKNDEMPPVDTKIANIEKTDVVVPILSGQVMTNKNNIETTTFININKDQNYDEPKEFPSENNTEPDSQNKLLSVMNTENTQFESNETNKLETTSEGGYSINKQFQGSEDDKNLIDVLDINNIKKNMSYRTSTEKDLTDESTDVTFDAISMLYNRSSKSISKEGNIEQIVTESNDILKEKSGESTTDSDWLSETVTEVNFEDVMNGTDKQETTETSATKIDEIMGRGNNKDDFEPDYLNNMGSNTTKVSDTDEPLYGMPQDYDNEDSRVKRVNMEKEKSETENIMDSSKQEILVATNVPSSSSFETTTIEQYIYKTSEQNLIETTTNSESSMATPKPAPVWEENENKEDLSVKELPKPTQANENKQPLDDSNIVTTSLSNNVNHYYQENSAGMTDSMPQNTTQVNNLNVTIYEISSHNENQSFVSPKTTSAPSSEFVDHETEMNPFLPEIENNKSLVKKLQEGHDIEPTNLNETQNDNIEEHNTSSFDGISSVESKQTIQSYEANASNNALPITPRPGLETTTSVMENEDFLFNHLFTNSNSHEQDSEYSTEFNKVATSPPLSNTDEKIMTESAKLDDKEVLPISTFLLDTDDLDTTKRPSITPEIISKPSISIDQTTPNPIKEDDSEYLSVVPIEQEKIMQPLKQDYSSESNQELNYISDPPTKSDRRTIDESSLDSDINNVA